MSSNIVRDFEEGSDPTNVEDIKVPPIKVVSQPQAPDIQSNAFTQGVMPSDVPNTLPEGSTGTPTDFLTTQIQGNLPVAPDIPTMMGGTDVTQQPLPSIRPETTPNDILEGRQTAQQQTQSAFTGQAIDATTLGSLHGNYLPTLYHGASANDLAQQSYNAINRNTNIYNTGAIARQQQAKSTTDLINQMSAKKQERDDPKQFRPDSTKDAFGNIVGWLLGKEEPGKPFNPLKSQWGDYGSGFIPSLMYGLSLPFAGFWSGVQDLKNKRDELVDKLPKPIKDFLNINPYSILKSLPGQQNNESLSLFHDNNKSESHFLNTLRGQKPQSFANYSDEKNSFIGMRQRQWNLKWYQDPSFWGGIVADIVTDPTDAIFSALKGTRAVTPREAMKAVTSAKATAEEAGQRLLKPAEEKPIAGLLAPAKESPRQLPPGGLRKTTLEDGTRAYVGTGDQLVKLGDASIIKPVITPPPKLQPAVLPKRDLRFPGGITPPKETVSPRTFAVPESIRLPRYATLEDQKASVDLYKLEQQIAEGKRVAQETADIAQRSGLNKLEAQVNEGHLNNQLDELRAKIQLGNELDNLENSIVDGHRNALNDELTRLENSTISSQIQPKLPGANEPAKLPQGADRTLVTPNTGADRVLTTPPPPEKAPSALQEAPQATVSTPKVQTPSLPKVEAQGAVLPGRVFNGEYTLSEFANAISKPVDGMVVNPASLNKSRRTLEDMNALARVIPDPTGVPILPEGAKGFRTWNQLQQRLAEFSDSAYGRIFQQYGAKIDRDALAQPSFTIKLSDGRNVRASKFDQLAEKQRAIAKGVEQVTTPLPPKETPKVPDALAEARKTQREAVKRAEEAKTLPELEAAKADFMNADNVIAKPDVTDPAQLKMVLDEVIPKGRRVTDLEALAKDIELQNRHMNVSHEVTDLSLQYRDAQHAREKLTREVLSNHADLGRQYADVKPRVDPSLVPPELRKPIEHTGETAEAFQGTRVVNPSYQSDPLIGGARNELGAAHYFTTDANEARLYAEADTARDLPVVEGREFGHGAVHQVQIDPSALVDFNLKPTADAIELAQNAAYKAIKEEGMPATISKIYEKAAENSPNWKALYGAFDETLKKVYGNDVPTHVIENFQRSFNESLRRYGISGFMGTVPSGATHYAIIDGEKALPRIVDSVLLPHSADLTDLHIAAQRLNADSLQALNNPGHLASKVNMMESAVRLQSSILEDLKTKLDDAVGRQLDNIDEMTAHWADMTKQAKAEAAAKRIQVEEQVTKHHEDLMRHLDGFNDSPCSF